MDTILRARAVCESGVMSQTCESALEAGPRLEPIQAIEFLAKSQRLGGSRSAPIRTPPRTKFTLRSQSLKAGRRWGPYQYLGTFRQVCSTFNGYIVTLRLRKPMIYL